MNVKAIGVLLIACISIFLSIPPAGAQNDSSTALNLPLNGSSQGSISSQNTVNWWKITTNLDGILSVSVNAEQTLNVQLILYDANITELTQNVATQATVTKVNAAVGTYFVKVVQWTGQGSYSISNSLTLPPRVIDPEPNDTSSKAVSLAVNGSDTGHLYYYSNGAHDTDDWYVVKTTGDGTLTVNTNADETLNIQLFLYDEGMREMTQNVATNAQVSKPDLAAGTYYILARQWTGYGTYTVSNTFTGATLPNDAEPNNTYEVALSLAFRGSKTGHMNYYSNGARDQGDWYIVTTSGDGALTVKADCDETLNVQLILYDFNRTELGQNISTHASITRNDLAAGTYYVLVNIWTGYGSYNLSNTLTDATLSNDTEPNDTYDVALPLAFGGSAIGHMNYYLNGARDQGDWYIVTTKGDGVFTVKADCDETLNVQLFLYDINRTELGQNISRNASVIRNDLAAGTYYVLVYTWTGYGSYTLSNSLTPPPRENDKEPNDAKEVAIPLDLNGSLTGHLHYYHDGAYDNADWYVVTTNRDGSLTVRVEGDETLNTQLILYDEGMRELTQNIATTASVTKSDLAQGTYYILVNYWTGYGSYKIINTLTNASLANDAEPNNASTSALTLAVNGYDTGHIGYYFNGGTDNSDWYVITTPADGSLTVRTTAEETLNIQLILYDQDVRELTQNVANKASVTYNNLAAGTYYVLAQRWTGYGSYTISNDFTRAQYLTDTEPNDSRGAARSVSVITTFTGHIGYYSLGAFDTVDFFSFTIPSAYANLYVRLIKSDSLTPQVILYKSDGSELVNRINDNVISYSNAQAGTYYLSVGKWTGYGSYAFIVSDSADLVPTPEDVGPGEQILFADDFNNNQIDTAWELSGGTWTEMDGVMTQTNNYYDSGYSYRGGVFALVGSNLWADYTTTVDIRSDDNDRMGIVFRYRDSLNFYVLSWDRELNERAIVRIHNGEEVKLVSENVAYESGKWYKLKIAAEGPNIRCYIDGVLLYNLLDTTFSRGRVGLYNNGNSAGYFDNISVAGTMAVSNVATITGVVKDHTTNAGMYAVITVTPGDYTTTADSKGAYTIEDIPQGDNYTVTASAPGYTSSEQRNIQVSEGEIVTVSFLLNPVAAGGPVAANLIVSPDPTSGAAILTVTAKVSTASSGKIAPFDDVVYTTHLSGSSKTGTSKPARVSSIDVNNSYVKASVSDYGEFFISTTTDKLLLYGDYTGRTYVRIDGVSHWFGSSEGTWTTPLATTSNQVRGVWEIGDIAVTFSLSIVQSTTTGNYDTFMIAYDIRNRGTGGRIVGHEVGLFKLLDTMINANDYAPVSAGDGYNRNEREFTGDSVLNFWQAFEESPSQGTDKLVAQGTLFGGGSVKPDRFVIGDWTRLENVSWDYTPAGQYDDSAVGMWWNPVTLSGGSSRKVVTQYGLGKVETASGVLSLSISGESSLSFENNQLTPNPFQVSAIVSNGTGAAVSDVRVKLTLPEGLSLAQGESSSRVIGTIQDGESKQVTFLVTAAEKSAESTYTYSVVVDNASTGAAYVTGEKTVFVPAAVAVTRLYISSAEVFIDIDPGQGSGQVMTTVDGFFDEQTEDVTAAVNISSLNYGYHTVYVRGEDSNGNWGAAVAYRFYHTSSIAGEFYAPPRNVIVTDVPDDQGRSVKVSWTLSQDDALITHYNIYRSRNPHLTNPVSIESLKSPEALIETEKVSTILVSSVPQGVNTFTDTSLPEGGIQYYYWVEAVSNTGASEKVAAGILTAVGEKTYEFRVQAPYPNPFNPSTTIQYEVAEQCHVRLIVYDILGREVAVLEDGVKPAGIHQASWNGYDENGMLAGTGLYLFRFNAGKFTANGKLTFMR